MQRLYHMAHTHKALKERRKVWLMFRRVLEEAPIVGYAVAVDKRSRYHVIVYVPTQQKPYSVALDASVQALGTLDTAQMTEWFKWERL